MTQSIDLTDPRNCPVEKDRLSISGQDLENHAKRAFGFVDAVSTNGRLYAVSRQASGSAAVAQGLAAALAQELEVVLVNTIPHTPDGDVDVAALQAIAPVSTGTLAKLEKKTGVTAALARRQIPLPVAAIADLAPEHAVLGERYEAVTLDSLAAKTQATGERPSVAYGEAVPPVGESICIAEALDRAAGSDAGIRFIAQDGIRPISYRRFREAVLRQSGALRLAGLGPGQSVILCHRDAEAFISAFWACLHAGVTAIPLRPPRLWSEEDPIARRFVHMYALQDAPAVLAEEADRDGIRRMLSAAGLLRPRLPSLAEPEGRTEAYRWPAGQTAMITFTSGSTGLPKGVPLSAANLVSTPLNLQRALGLAAGDALLSIMTLDHAGSLVGFCGAAIWSCADLVVAPLDPVLGEPSLLIDWLEATGITHSWAPDFLWQLLATAAADTPRAADLTRLKALISGGESVRRETFVRLKQVLVRHGVSGNILRTAWGMSETTSFMTLSLPWDDDRTHAVKGGILDNGRPLGGNAFRIVDAAGNILPETVTGRLQARGVSVFSGYSKNQEASHTEDGWMTTGDLAEMHDGRTIICGREKEMLIVNGQNIPQVEIEGQIERLPGVLANHVVAVATRNTLSAQEELIIFAVPTDENLPDAARARFIGQISGAVAGFCGAKPTHVLLVERADIPKTGIGKLQRSQLRKAFERGDFNRLVRANDLLLSDDRLISSRSYQPVWETVRPSSTTGSLSGRAFLLLGNGLEELSTRLRAHGASTATSFDNLPQGCDDLTVIDGRALTLASGNGERIDVTSSVADLARLSGELARLNFPSVELVVLTRQALHVPGDDPTRGTAGEALPGAVNALSSENNGLTGRVIDLAEDDRPDAILPWLTSGIPGKVLALRAGHCKVLRLGAPGDRGVVGKSNSFNNGDIVVVTGGLGRIGRCLTRRLAIAGGCRVVIAGRRAPAEVKQELAAIREGAEASITYVQADICNPTDVEALFESTRQAFGRAPSIVLNLAGETGRSPVAEVDSALIERFVAARIDGIETLTKSLAAEGGGTVVSLSSAFACIGTHDHFAHLSGEAALSGTTMRLAGRYGNVRQLCLLSAPWLTEQQPPGFSTYLRRLGLHPLTPLQGLAGIVRLLDKTGVSGVATLGIDVNAPAWADFTTGKPSAVEEITVASEGERLRCLDALAEISPNRTFPVAAVQRQAETGTNATSGPVSLILAIWREVLGAERPYHPEQNFFDAGGTSIAATKVHARLVAAGYKTTSLIDIFVHPTPNALAAFLLSGSTAIDAPNDNLLDEAKRRHKRREAARRDRRVTASRS